MRKLTGLIKTVFFIAIIQGCSTPYYGYSKSDWYALSIIERAEIEKEYEFVKNTRKEQKHKDIINARTQSIIDLGVDGGKNQKGRIRIY